MNTILKNLYVSRELNSLLFNPICSKYDLTLAEIIVLIFLEDNCECDTAKDIVENLKIAKSHVSASVKNLERRGYLKGFYEENNHRTIHLRLCQSSFDVLDDAHSIQKQFITLLKQEFSEEELNNFKLYLQRVAKNISAYQASPVSVDNIGEKH